MYVSVAEGDDILTTQSDGSILSCVCVIESKITRFLTAAGRRGNGHELKTTGDHGFKTKLKKICVSYKCKSLMGFMIWHI